MAGFSRASSYANPRGCSAWLNRVAESPLHLQPSAHTSWGGRYVGKWAGKSLQLPGPGAVTGPELGPVPSHDGCRTIELSPSLQQPILGPSASCRSLDDSTSIPSRHVQQEEAGAVCQKSGTGIAPTHRQRPAGLGRGRPMCNPA